ncbi:hypothetical protein Aph01nite_08350 [Acrocarpospora phusangensis]|uniref:Uncharacterized protein n=1 Tax=Acrocarpospora phusangensis TaxID=1070424 RepID=A0A919Q995_9ACTN|nr:hypothetical protein [Acrocarpospora phusangensis]GIH22525.1 hypothetical protein Aph01nite_08350 [Acrocarpospora phusangensis]
MTIDDRYALLAAEHAELVAAARAAVAGARLGEGDPLIHVRHVLDRHGQLPPEGSHPATILSWPSGYRGSPDGAGSLPSPEEGSPTPGRGLKAGV